MRTLEPMLASFLRRKPTYTSTWFSTALESYPHTRARMASLDRLRPFACIRQRITSNSRADSRTHLSPQARVEPSRSSTVFPKRSSSTCPPWRRSSAPTQASSSRVSKGLAR